MATIDDKRSRMQRILRSQWFRWGLVGLAVLVVVAYVLLVFVNQSYKKSIERQGRELAVEIQTYVVQRYGDLTGKKNGWQYIVGLPDRSDIRDLVDAPPYEYERLGIPDKKAKLDAINAFQYCDELKAIEGFDVIVPEWFYPFKIEDFAKSAPVFGSEISLVKLQNAINHLTLCADWRIANGETAEGLSLLERGYKLVGMLPAETLIHCMMKMSLADILTLEVRKQFGRFDADQLSRLELAMTKSDLLAPIDYYSYQLFETYWNCALRVDKNIIDIQSKNGWRTLGQDLIAPVFCTEYYMSQSISGKRGFYETMKKRFQQMEITPLGQALQETVSRQSCGWPIKKLLEMEAKTLDTFIVSAFCDHRATITIMKVAVNARIYQIHRGTYPHSFIDLKDVLASAGCIPAENPRETECRGYRFGFVDAMTDGAKYADPPNDQSYIAFYAVPMVPGNPRQSQYIMNETGSMYHKDTITTEPIKAWPQDLDNSAWLLVK